MHDEALFKEPPPPEDCPICMLPLSLDPRHATFQSCCGKTICNGCIDAMAIEDMKKGKKWEDHMCPYCRTLRPSSDEEVVKRLKKIMEKGNAMAYYWRGLCRRKVRLDAR